MEVKQILCVIENNSESALHWFFNVYLDFLAYENLKSCPESLIMFECYLRENQLKKEPFLSCNPTGKFSLVIPEPFGEPIAILVDFF